MLRVQRLIWDTWNVVHIARHDVIPSEVEEVCHGKPITADTYKGRLRVIGPTITGRMLTVILDKEPEDKVYYPITARPSDRKERREYTQIIKGTKL